MMCCVVTMIISPLPSETSLDEHACGRGYVRSLHLHPHGPHPHRLGGQDSQRLVRISKPYGHTFTVNLIELPKLTLCLCVYFYLQEGRIEIRWTWTCRRKLVSSGLISLRRHWTCWFPFTKVTSALHLQLNRTPIHISKKRRFYIFIVVVVVNVFSSENVLQKSHVYGGMVSALSFFSQ